MSPAVAPAPIKVVTVNRTTILENAEKRYYYSDKSKPKKAPIEIQVFREGKKTELITAMDMKIEGECSVKYDPSKFVAPRGCGSAIATPKAVWIETKGKVTYTDSNGNTHTI